MPEPDPDTDCDHEVFARVGSTNGVYRCTACDGLILIPQFRWVTPPGEAHEGDQ